MVTLFEHGLAACTSIFFSKAGSVLLARGVSSKGAPHLSEMLEEIDFDDFPLAGPRTIFRDMKSAGF